MSGHHRIPLSRAKAHHKAICALRVTYPEMKAKEVSALVGVSVAVVNNTWRRYATSKHYKAVTPEFVEQLRFLRCEVGADVSEIAEYMGEAKPRIDRNIRRFGMKKDPLTKRVERVRGLNPENAEWLNDFMKSFNLTFIEAVDSLVTDARLDDDNE